MPCGGKLTPASPPVMSSASKPRQVRKVSGDRDVARFAAQPIANPLRADRRAADRAWRRAPPARCTRARTPGRLLRAQLAAVPHHLRLRAHRPPPSRRRASTPARPTADSGRRGSSRSDRVAVMHQNNCTVCSSVGRPVHSGTHIVANRSRPLLATTERRRRMAAGGVPRCSGVAAAEPWRCRRQRL